MDSLKLWARQGAAGRQASELGEMAHIETASEECTDEFLLLAIDSGLLQRWAGTFPAPRRAPEMTMEGIVPAHIAARFAGLYWLRQAGYVLRSARVWGALGSSVAVVAPERGLSVRGTSDDKLLRGDGVRKLLVQMAQQAALSPPPRRPPPEPSVALTVRQRASRRAVQQAIDEAEAAARAYHVADPLVGWYNQQGGVSRLQDARRGRGRRLHILDTTHVEVAWETGTYACSGVVTKEAGTRARGDQLATWRTRLARAGLLTQRALAAIQVPAMAWGRPVREEAPVWRARDLLLEDRGCIDGATLSTRQRQRQVEVIIALKANRLATQEARPRAERADKWPPHPARAAQTIALGRGVEPRWTEGAVPLNACVMRFWKKKKKCPEPIVLITTDLKLSAPWIGRHYEERPEIEQDDAQMKSGGWQLKKLSATR